MRNSNRHFNLVALLLAATAWLAMDSSAHAWPVNRFHGTRSTKTVADAFRDYERTGSFFPPTKCVQSTQRRPVNRFHRATSTDAVPTNSEKPRFFLFNLFR